MGLIGASVILTYFGKIIFIIILEFPVLASSLFSCGLINIWFKERLGLKLRKFYDDVNKTNEKKYLDISR